MLGCYVLPPDANLAIPRVDNCRLIQTQSSLASHSSLQLAQLASMEGGAGQGLHVRRVHGHFVAPAEPINVVLFSIDCVDFELISEWTPCLAFFMSSIAAFCALFVGQSFKLIELERD